jgi:EAL domain-containing protein (putative c-di-GMP-specific phosphodiesterase class I)/AmiR/NasT family two-component response regulator
MRIVIIDDDPFLLKILNLQLRNFGLRDRGFDAVAAYESSQDALDAIQAHGVDQVGLIFCDLQMPGMDGVELLRHLGQVGYRGGIVLVSGTGERVLEAARQLSKAHGLNLVGSIDKPVTPERLRAIIHSWVPPQSMVAEAPVERYSDEALRAALEAGELTAFFQPIVALADGRVARHEVLLRWQHPSRGLLLPAPILEAIDDPALRRALFEHVLALAVEQAADWAAAGRAADIALNVALGADDLDLEFPDRLESLARGAGIAPSAIGLELTFDRSMTQLSAPLEVLARLRLKHFRLSLDRFGTASAPPELLRDMTVDEIKLDGGLVHGAAHQRSLGAILASSVDLARRLGLDAAAVRIEDAADWKFVRSLGYTFAQGYFVGAPMAAGEMPAWHEAWASRRSALFD